MGILARVKSFAGGHGVTAKITSVERQSPERAVFPLTDSVMKFQVEVTGDRPVVILNHRFEVWAERRSDTNPRLVHVAQDVHDAKTDILGGQVKWPYTLEPGKVIRDGCCISDVDLARALEKMEVSSPEAAVDDPNIRFFVKFVADVLGSSMHAHAESGFRVAT